MKARFKIGLATGLVGLVLNICVSATVGLCGPAVSLVAGVVAGFFTARAEKAATKSAGAQAGAISGLVAGILIILGQLIGGVGVLVFAQTTNSNSIFGKVPSINADMPTQIGYYVGGVGVGICFGLIGAVLSALAGAGTGYLGTPDPEPESPPAMM